MTQARRPGELCVESRGHRILVSPQDADDLHGMRIDRRVLGAGGSFENVPGA